MSRMNDQVARLERWTAEHPDVEIQAPDYASGAQLWTAHKGGIVVCCEYDLRVLLDRLDWLMAQEQPTHV
jgi:hypothetical protein